jgi:hypothetical protein
MSEQKTEKHEAIAPSVAPVAARATTQASVKKVADRPHWITVVLGLVSPLLAGVALIISLESLHTSERTLEVGQRAYVALQDGKITFSRITLRSPVPSSTVTPGGAEIQAGQEQLATMLLSVKVVNSGNTPAEFTSFIPNFKQLPEGWTLKKKEWEPTQKTPPSLGAKSKSLWEYRESFLLTPQAWSDYSRLGRPGLYFSGELKYLDVFKNKHSVNWCWMTFADEHNLGQVFDCGEMIFERTK